MDPLAMKFAGQSPYVFAANSPILNIDQKGKFRYPKGKEGDTYKAQFPMITAYLAKYVQNDIKKSPIVQEAVTKNTYGGYTKSELIWVVAAWENQKSPEISFDEGLAERTGAYGHTKDGQHIKIDAEFARAVEKVLSSNTATAKEKKAALTSFYTTLLDETTHTGDLKNGSSRSAPEVGKDATLEIIRGEKRKTDEGDIWVDLLNDDDPTNKSDFSKTSKNVERKEQMGQTEVLPTVPTKEK